MEVIRSKAPLRVSFCGGGTDYPHYYGKFGGACLSATINRYVHVELIPRDDKEINILSILGKTQIKVGRKLQLDGDLDLCKAAVLALPCDKGMDIEIRSDIVVGSGLGGSAALTAAIIGAVAKYTGKALTDYERADLNYYTEHIIAKVPGGRQDHYATVFGGINFIEFSTDKTVVTPINNKKALSDLENNLLFYYTGSIRENLDLVGTQTKDFKQGKKKSITSTHEMKRIATDMKDDLLKGNIDSFGPLFDQSYQNKLIINTRVFDGTNVEEIYAEAKHLGVTGGKLCGAGGGGYMLLYCPSDKQEQVKQSLTKMGGNFEKLSFEYNGLQVKEGGQIL